MPALLALLASLLCQAADEGAPRPAWQRLAAVTDDDLADVRFFERSGFAYSRRGTIVATTDGGLTWNVAHRPHPDARREVSYRSAGFDSRKKGWVLAEYSPCMASQFDHVMVTDNGGRTWRREEGALTVCLGEASFEAANGERWSYDGFVWVEAPGSDPCRNADSVPFLADHPDLDKPTFCDVAFSSPHIGLLTGRDLRGGFVLRTDDGGTNWRRLRAPELLELKPGGVCMSGDEAVIAAGPRLLRSRDGGVRWTVDWAGRAGEHIGRLARVPTGGMVGVGSRGLILRFSR